MAEFPSEEHRQAYLGGLALERAGFAARKDKDGVAAVDAEIERVTGPKPVEAVPAVETRPVSQDGVEKRG